MSLGIDTSRLGVAGDSAGATLAAVAAHDLTRSGEVALAVQVLLCPIMDHSAVTTSRQTLKSGYLLDQETLDHDLAHYLPAGADPLDPRISPLRAADLTGLPPAVVHTAEYDPLADEGRAYADRLRLAGVPVTFTCHPGMIHLFYAMAGVIPYARIAFDKVGADVRAALS